MEKLHFEVEKDGFHGVYWQNKMPSNVAIIAMLGDDAEDYMAKEFPKGCKQTRVDIDRRIVEVIKEWRSK